MKKVTKMFLYIILAVVAAIVVTATIYLNFSPQVGGATTNHNSEHKLNGKFKNLIETPMSTGDKSMLAILFEFFFRKNPDAFPENVLETERIDLERIANLRESEVLVTWLGHSTVLISTKSLNIITDPVLSGKRIPPMYMGPKPFPYSNSYRAEDLPKIDVVLISHDHYDHLDMETVKKFKDARFFVPLGVGQHLKSWEIKESRISEFDWYEEKEHPSSLRLSFLPARHFSGRGLFNRDTTLWGSWSIQLGDRKIYFGGDSGYFKEFKKIGEKYGPFDLAMLDAGQYGEDWSAVHMLPPQTAMAGIDLKAKAILPIHNSKYILANHAWYDPLEQVSTEARKRKLKTATPRPGQSFLLGKDVPSEKWWE